MTTLVTAAESLPAGIEWHDDVETPEKIFVAGLGRYVVYTRDGELAYTQFGGESVRWLHRLITETGTLTRVERSANGRLPIADHRRHPHLRTRPAPRRRRDPVRARDRSRHVTGYVGYVGDETPYPYCRPDGDEFGFGIPIALIERLDAAEREHDAATEAIRRYIEANQVPEVELDEVDL